MLVAPVQRSRLIAVLHSAAITSRCSRITCATRAGSTCLDHKEGQPAADGVVAGTVDQRAVVDGSCSGGPLSGAALEHKRADGRARRYLGMGGGGAEHPGAGSSGAHGDGKGQSSGATAQREVMHHTDGHFLPVEQRCSGQNRCCRALGARSKGPLARSAPADETIMEEECIMGTNNLWYLCRESVTKA